MRRKVKDIKISNVEIVLENCECYKFKAEDINLEMQNVAFRYHGDLGFAVAKDIEIRIEKDAEATGGLEKKWQDRIHRDITQIHINYEDGSNEVWWPDWSDKSDYENFYQKDTEDAFCKIYTISKKKNPFK